jgi:tRNA-dihydrouridine synthase
MLRKTDAPLWYLLRRRCAGIAAEADLPLVGNGDVFSYSEWAARLAGTGVATGMIGRAALIKPWIFTGESCSGFHQAYAAY